jgi:GNAT superfamily N-acetyltransferase
VRVSLPVGYALFDEPPSLDEYLRLRRDSGLTPKNQDQGRGALAGSWSFCHIRATADDSAVAMGRVIGDGGWYFLIADMATLPEHQRLGLGRVILDNLLDGIRVGAPERPWVTLFADGPGRHLYASVGFTESAPASLGMQMILEP